MQEGSNEKTICERALKKAKSCHSGFRKPNISEGDSSEGYIVERGGVVGDIRNSFSLLDGIEQLLLRFNWSDDPI